MVEQGHSALLRVDSEPTPARAQETGGLFESEGRVDGTASRGTESSAPTGFTAVDKPMARSRKAPRNPSLSSSTPPVTFPTATRRKSSSDSNRPLQGRPILQARDRIYQESPVSWQNTPNYPPAAWNTTPNFSGYGYSPVDARPPVWAQPVQAAATGSNSRAAPGHVPALVTPQPSWYPNPLHRQASTISGYTARDPFRTSILEHRNEEITDYDDVEINPDSWHMSQHSLPYTTYALPYTGLSRTPSYQPYQDPGRTFNGHPPSSHVIRHDPQTDPRPTPDIAVPIIPAVTRVVTPESTRPRSDSRTSWVTDSPYSELDSDNGSLRPLGVPTGNLNPRRFNNIYLGTSAVASRVALSKSARMTQMALSKIYNLCLLHLPSLYFSRVARIFEEADLSLPELKKMALEAGRKSKALGFQPLHLDAHNMSQGLPPVYSNLKHTWESFIECMMREWKVFNIVSVLLLSAILTFLQIEAAANDALTRYTGLASLICALMSLLYGCMYIIRFGSMRSTYKAAEWALEAKSSKTSISWNVWVLLAMPGVWLSWSLILYIFCIMSFLWRTSIRQDSQSLDLSIPEGLLLTIRVSISMLLVLGLVYGVLILSTFRRYGQAMDNKWKGRINDWIEAQSVPPSVYQGSFAPQSNPYLTPAYAPPGYQDYQRPFSPSDAPQHHYAPSLHPDSTSVRFSRHVNVISPASSDEVPAAQSQESVYLPQIQHHGALLNFPSVADSAASSLDFDLSDDESDDDEETMKNTAINARRHRALPAGSEQPPKAPVAVYHDLPQDTGRWLPLEGIKTDGDGVGRVERGSPPTVSSAGSIGTNFGGDQGPLEDPINILDVTNRPNTEANPSNYPEHPPQGDHIQMAPIDHSPSASTPTLHPDYSSPLLPWPPTNFPAAYPELNPEGHQIQSPSPSAVLLPSLLESTPSGLEGESEGRHQSHHQARSVSPTSPNHRAYLLDPCYRPPSGIGSPALPTETVEEEIIDPRTLRALLAAAGLEIQTLQSDPRVGIPSASRGSGSGRTASI